MKDQVGRSNVGRSNQRAWVSTTDIDNLRHSFVSWLLETSAGHLEGSPDRDDIAAWGHKLAGNGGVFGFDEITRLGRLLETQMAHLDDHDITEHLQRIQAIAREAGGGS